jgi:hypothetical protein
MKRREFLSALSSAAIITPLRASAQETMPVIGFLNPTSPAGYPHVIAAFRRGLLKPALSKART